MNIGSKALIAAGVASYGIGVVAANAYNSSNNTAPWVWRINGPGSIGQVPSMLVPWGLPAIGLMAGGMALYPVNRTAGIAVGLLGVAAHGAGFQTWLHGMKQNHE